jgi:hypothetical protein
MSDAVPDTVIVPDTVAPLVGEAMATLGVEEVIDTVKAREAFWPPESLA